MDEKKKDPLSDEVYKPLLLADKALKLLFYFSAILSVLSLVTHENTFPFSTMLQPLFLTTSLVYFCLSLAVRLHFFPRAQIRRYRDFLGHAIGRQADHKQTTGYYNNKSAIGPNRVAAQVLESAFFSKEILSRMLPWERTIVGIYFLLWILAVYHRQTDLIWVGVLAQFLFSEEILSHWFRLEWLKWKTDQIYDGLCAALRNNAELDLLAWEQLGKYEIVKASAASSLSKKIFEKYNDALNDEWKSIRKSIGL